MKFIDMFAGIGGFRSGLEQAGHKCIGYIKWDKFARQSYEAMYDTKGEYTANDIQKVKGTDLPTADAWTFGSPYTNISLAGNRKGLQGEQSRMFFEVIRLLKEQIGGEKALPQLTIMENVKNLLSSNGGRDFATVLAEMESVGYDVEWAVLNTADVLPQNRERVYIIGHLRGSSIKPIFPIRQEIKDAASKEKIKIVGNASATNHHGDDIMGETGISPTINATAYKHTPKIAVHQIGNYLNTDSFGGNPQVGRVYGTDGLSPTLNTMQGGDRQPKILTYARQSLAVRKLTPRECWRLQGFSDQQFDKAKTAGVSNSQLYKQAGNAVSVPVVRAIGEKINEYWEKKNE